ncbi:hypothetical protein BESB_003450 [Besnoitia besnoiti]|uniref:C3H1-type domain-containing protein n=1 Tax=Besnoitia besnoiti TaxID=94643 RepID=A0A2A9ML85_BESBE|nr:hypothetical protein BESB_003450 [Besnoitia besnoiti]PFH38004.1 hypothetical protein BESB_003450 [Besnoitia besnoiti]
MLKPGNRKRRSCVDTASGSLLFWGVRCPAKLGAGGNAGANAWCPDGDKCLFCHTESEYFGHPGVYKTVLCSNAKGHSGKTCCFSSSTASSPPQKGQEALLPFCGRTRCCCWKAHGKAELRTELAKAYLPTSRSVKLASEGAATSPSAAAGSCDGWKSLALARRSCALSGGAETGAEGEAPSQRQASCCALAAGSERDTPHASLSIAFRADSNPGTAEGRGAEARRSDDAAGLLCRHFSPSAPAEKVGEDDSSAVGEKASRAAEKGGGEKTKDGKPWASGCVSISGSGESAHGGECGGGDCGGHRDPKGNAPPASPSGDGSLNVFLPDGSLDLALFKVFPCRNRTLLHERKSCPYYHNYRDKRRAPVTYRAEQCDEHFDLDTATIQCSKGDNCERCHNRHELLYHPNIYKQRFCSNLSQNERGGTTCCARGVFCAFAHSRSEIRATLFTKQEEQEPDCQFFVAKFKTVWCPYGSQHDWHTCVYAHTYQDCRRVPAIGYGSEPCPAWSKDLHSADYERRCPHGARCSFSHGSKEQLYHPSYYKTMPCIDYRPPTNEGKAGAASQERGRGRNGGCPRGFLCAFYHDVSERRTPVPPVSSTAGWTFSYSSPLPLAQLKLLQPLFLEPPLFNLDDFEAFGHHSRLTAASRRAANHSEGASSSGAILTSYNHANSFPASSKSQNGRHFPARNGLSPSAVAGGGALPQHASTFSSNFSLSSPGYCAAPVGVPPLPPTSASASAGASLVAPEGDEETASSGLASFGSSPKPGSRSRRASSSYSSASASAVGLPPLASPCGAGASAPATAESPSSGASSRVRADPAEAMDSSVSAGFATQGEFSDAGRRAREDEAVPASSDVGVVAKSDGASCERRGAASRSAAAAEAHKGGAKKENPKRVSLEASAQEHVAPGACEANGQSALSPFVSFSSPTEARVSLEAQRDQEELDFRGARDGRNLHTWSDPSPFASCPPSSASLSSSSLLSSGFSSSSYLKNEEHALHRSTQDQLLLQVAAMLLTNSPSQSEREKMTLAASSRRDEAPRAAEAERGARATHTSVAFSSQSGLPQEPAKVYCAAGGSSAHQVFRHASEIAGASLGASSSSSSVSWNPPAARFSPPLSSSEEGLSLSLMQGQCVADVSRDALSADLSLSERASRAEWTANLASSASFDVFSEQSDVLTDSTALLHPLGAGSLSASSPPLLSGESLDLEARVDHAKAADVVEAPGGEAEDGERQRAENEEWVASTQGSSRRDSAGDAWLSSLAEAAFVSDARCAFPASEPLGLHPTASARRGAWVDGEAEASGAKRAARRGSARDDPAHWPESRPEGRAVLLASLHFDSAVAAPRLFVPAEGPAGAERFPASHGLAISILESSPPVRQMAHAASSYPCSPCGQTEPPNDSNIGAASSASCLNSLLFVGGAEASEDAGWANVVLPERHRDGLGGDSSFPASSNALWGAHWGQVGGDEERGLGPLASSAPPGLVPAPPGLLRTETAAKGEGESHDNTRFASRGNGALNARAKLTEACRGEAGRSDALVRAHGGGEDAKGEQEILRVSTAAVTAVETAAVALWGAFEDEEDEERTRNAAAFGSRKTEECDARTLFHTRLTFLDEATSSLWATRGDGEAREAETGGRKESDGGEKTMALAVAVSSVKEQIKRLKAVLNLLAWKNVVLYVPSGGEAGAGNAEVLRDTLTQAEKMAYRLTRLGESELTEEALASALGGNDAEENFGNIVVVQGIQGERAKAETCHPASAFARLRAYQEKQKEAVAGGRANAPAPALVCLHGSAPSYWRVCEEAESEDAKSRQAGTTPALRSSSCASAPALVLHLVIAASPLALLPQGDSTEALVEAATGRLERPSPGAASHRHVVLPSESLPLWACLFCSPPAASAALALLPVGSASCSRLASRDKGAHKATAEATLSRGKKCAIACIPAAASGDSPTSRSVAEDVTAATAAATVVSGSPASSLSSLPPFADLAPLSPSLQAHSPSSGRGALRFVPLAHVTVGGEAEVARSDEAERGVSLETVASTEASAASSSSVSDLRHARSDRTRRDLDADAASGFEAENRDVKGKALAATLKGSYAEAAGAEKKGAALAATNLPRASKEARGSARKAEKQFREGELLGALLVRELRTVYEVSQRDAEHDEEGETRKSDLQLVFCWAPSHQADEEDLEQPVAVKSEQGPRVDGDSSDRLAVPLATFAATEDRSKLVLRGTAVSRVGAGSSGSSLSRRSTSSSSDLPSLSGLPAALSQPSPWMALRAQRLTRLLAAHGHSRPFLASAAVAGEASRGGGRLCGRYLLLGGVSGAKGAEECADAAARLSSRCASSARATLTLAQLVGGCPAATHLNLSRLSPAALQAKQSPMCLMRVDTEDLEHAVKCANAEAARETDFSCALCGEALAEGAKDATANSAELGVKERRRDGAEGVCCFVKCSYNREGDEQRELDCPHLFHRACAVRLTSLPQRLGAGVRCFCHDFVPRSAFCGETQGENDRSKDTSQCVSESPAASFLPGGSQLESGTSSLSLSFLPYYNGFATSAALEESRHVDAEKDLASCSLFFSSDACGGDGSVASDVVRTCGTATLALPRRLRLLVRDVVVALAHLQELQIRIALQEPPSTQASLSGQKRVEKLEGGAREERASEGGAKALASQSPLKSSFIFSPEDFEVRDEEGRTAMSLASRDLHPRGGDEAQSQVAVVADIFAESVLEKFISFSSRDILDSRRRLYSAAAAELILFICCSGATTRLREGQLRAEETRCRRVGDLSAADNKLRALPCLLQHVLSLLGERSGVANLLPAELRRERRLSEVDVLDRSVSVAEHEGREKREAKGSDAAAQGPAAPLLLLADVLLHPFFWSPQKRLDFVEKLQFFLDEAAPRGKRSFAAASSASDRPALAASLYDFSPFASKKMKDSHRRVQQETIRRDSRAIAEKLAQGWNKKVHAALLRAAAPAQPSGAGGESRKAGLPGDAPTSACAFSNDLCGLLRFIKSLRSSALAVCLNLLTAPAVAELLQMHPVAGDSGRRAGERRARHALLQEFDSVLLEQMNRVHPCLFLFLFSHVVSELRGDPDADRVFGFLSEFLLTGKGFQESFSVEKLL